MYLNATLDNNWYIFLVGHFLPEVISTKRRGRCATSLGVSYDLMVCPSLLSHATMHQSQCILIWYTYVEDHVHMSTCALLMHMRLRNRVNGLDFLASD